MAKDPLVANYKLGTIPGMNLQYLSLLAEANSSKKIIALFGKSKFILIWK
jgi:hypothetical protein